MVEFIENYLFMIISLIGVIVVAVLVTIATKKRKIFEDIFKNESKEKEERAAEKTTIEVTTSTAPNLTIDDIEKIKGELRIMTIEKEIVGYALTRLYEAEAEGRIGEKERILLLDKYKKDMQRLEKEIEKKQMIVKLRDLEVTKADLLKMFNIKLNEISKNIENIRATLGVPIEINQENNQETESLSTSTDRDKTVTPPNLRPKSEAEERIEAIQEEVLKVLERLEQIETEG